MMVWKILYLDGKSMSLKYGRLVQLVPLPFLSIFNFVKTIKLGLVELELFYAFLTLTNFWSNQLYNCSECFYWHFSLKQEKNLHGKVVIHFELF